MTKHIPVKSLRQRDNEAHYDAMGEHAIDGLAARQDASDIAAVRGMLTRGSKQSVEDFAAWTNKDPLTIRRWESGRVRTENMAEFAHELREELPLLWQMLDAEEIKKLYFTSQPGVNDFGSRTLELDINKLIDGCATYMHAKSGILQRAVAQDAKSSLGHPDAAVGITQSDALAKDVLKTIDNMLADHTHSRHEALYHALPSFGYTPKQAQLLLDGDRSDYTGVLTLMDHYRPIVEEICGMRETTKAVEARRASAGR